MRLREILDLIQEANGDNLIPNSSVPAQPKPTTAAQATTNATQPTQSKVAGVDGDEDDEELDANGNPVKPADGADEVEEARADRMVPIKLQFPMMMDLRE